jgi:hypothetical protein
VQQSKDYEALLALGSILNTNPDKALLGWEILIRKFGIKIGNFSATVLSGIVSNSAYSLLKSALATHGIILL